MADLLASSLKDPIEDRGPADQAKQIEATLTTSENTSGATHHAARGRLSDSLFVRSTMKHVLILPLSFNDSESGVC